ncbi:MAG: heparinase [Alphaproteobacteria bacterium]|nr:MAG: heparinase [Alphaproteobacteria bacterium]
MVIQTREDNTLADMAEATVTSALNSARNRSYASWIYNWSLKGPMPDRVLHTPELASTQRGDKADAFLSGRYILPGGQVRMTSGTPWDAQPPSREWSQELHSFTWLWHFGARPSADTSRHARWLIKTWLDKHKKCEGTPWTPNILGRRLISWYANWPLIVEGADMVWRSSLLLSMARQATHLRRAVKNTPPGRARFDAALALAMTGLCMPDQSKSLDKGLELLIKDLAIEVTGDGGHISRSPEKQLHVLADLLMLQEAMRARGQHMPSALTHVIDRMGPALDFFRHGDGRLALFNGGGLGDEAALAQACTHTRDLPRGTPRPAPLAALPFSGYQRLTAKKTTLIVDTGAPPVGAFSTDAHAGCLSFEMSSGRHRLITNCGAMVVQGPIWHQAMRATAAHSTLGLSQASSADFVTGAWTRNLLGPRISGGPSNVECTRHEKDLGIWLDTSHDGYLEDFGLIHERRLFLAADGMDVRGEDQLIAQEGRRAREGAESATIRFHLHPEVRASLARDGSNVLLVLPNRQGWQFRAKGGEISMEESIFITDGETVRRTSQIVVTAHPADNTTRVNWAFRCLEADKS